MIREIKCLCALIVSFCVFLALPLFAAERTDTHAAAGASSDQVLSYAPMPAPGQKVWIGNEYYFLFGFDKKPKLGIVIMKVEIHTPDGGRDTSLEVLADSGMPSMRGAHETGDRMFQVSKKRDYLLPINIVMPGDWEVRLTIRKSGKVIFRGSYKFDV